MDFRGDDRAQALQVGAILLFGFLIISLSLYQATVVPDQNRGVEFNAYQDAASDLTELRNDVITAASKDTTTGTNVRTGAEYPSRSVFINPPPPIGELRTTATRNITIENVTTVSGEANNTQQFVENGLAGSNYTTRAVRFTPDYNVFDAQPMVVTGHQAYRYTSGENGRFLPMTGQTLLQGDQLNLLFIAGDLSAQGTTTTVTTEPISASTRTVTVTGDGSSNITLELGTPPGITAETWVNRTGEQLKASNPRVLNVESQGGRIHITLNGSRTYKLKMAKVEVREENDVATVNDPKPAYVVGKIPDGTSVVINESVDVRVEVRDAYNNPLSGVTVEFTYPNGTTENVTTDSNGIAAIEYVPNDEGTKEFTAEITDSVVANGEPTTTLTVVSFESAASSGEGTTVGTSGKQEWSSDDSEEIISASGGLWKNVTGVNRLLLSDPIFSPTTASSDQSKQSSRFFRLVYGVTDGQTTYYMIFTKSSEGLKYELNQGPGSTWSSLSVRIIKENPDETTVSKTAELNVTALNQWFDPGTTKSEPLNVLEPSAYETGSGSTFRELLTETKQQLRNESNDLFIAQMHGRTELNATPVGQSLAYVDEFHDDDGSSEAQENASLSPSPTDGDMSSFKAVQQESNTADLQTTSTFSNSLTVRNLTTTATYGIKTQSVSKYTLELGYSMGGGNESDVEIRIVDANGSVLQTANLSSEITLNQAAEDEVKATGNLYVVYAQVSGGDLTINIEYQRVRAE
ncbi:MAG: Ig-like domain-containing protein [Halopenitus sp.]